MNIITIEEQTFKQLCSRFANFANQVERICRLNNHQSDKWLSGREVCPARYQHPKFAELPGQW